VTPERSVDARAMVLAAAVVGAIAVVCFVAPQQVLGASEA
jgi:hypothetical protein